MSFSGSGFMGGAASGASAGMAAGPWGALAGGVAGGLMGGFMGEDKPNFSGLEAILAQRRSEIAEFSNRLELARNNVLTNQKDLQATTMSRFMPMMQAYLGGRGLSANGGAFASALAKEATGMQGQYDMLNSSLTQKNLYDVESERASLLGPSMGLEGMKMKMNFEQSQAQSKAIGTSMTDLIGGAAKQYRDGRNLFASMGSGGTADMGGNGVLAPAYQKNPFASFNGGN